MERALFISPAGAEAAASRVTRANKAITHAHVRPARRRGETLGWTVLMRFSHGLTEYMTEKQAEIFGSAKPGA